eukprot:CAMPEP_0202898210 /NCGR_PEP_ID=MMETSP1392-20130828/6781_1 /ASSEMBLY_ACC=CAM_ASM_000868 /TAXON_ID=225041 /ORGANISM="Chlamydomonas chlamydogama, Strain SAG 11-48b" /LENGTH=306 /DNA_ID=CAMNT_0049584069 /DNA_START=194 /DNA_END=1113 /DNA_ORIENTATION=+
MLQTAAVTAAFNLFCSPSGSALSTQSKLLLQVVLYFQPQRFNAALSKSIGKAKAPVVLRLAFHDAGSFSTSDGTGGLNASIQFELERPENFGLKRGWRIIEEVAKNLKGTAAEGVVSRADLVALAGAQAVAVCGGPRIAVPIGRVDASGPDPEGRLPGMEASAVQIKANFADKGLDVREMVALLGSHTIGSKGFGAPDVFDNAYFVELLKKPWLNKDDSMASMIGLPSDHVLPDDEECLPYIKEFAADQDAFFEAFTSAYLKMTNLGAQWGERQGTLASAHGLTSITPEAKKEEWLVGHRPRPDRW